MNHKSICIKDMIIRKLKNTRRIFQILMLPFWKSQYNHTGKIALCCIAKLENDYIRFFVEYYKNLHFDKIIIYDNNDPDGERFDDVIGDYMQSQFVEVIDFRGKVSPLFEAYQDFYDRYNKEYDWIAFFDCDEFLTFADDTKDIHTFLNQKLYQPYQAIHFNWMVFGDNELLDSDGRNVIERFKNPILPYDFKTPYRSFPENNHIRTILRGGLKGIKWIDSPHSPRNKYYRCCNPSGSPASFSSSRNSIDYNKAYIRHYSTKTIGEWVKNKMKRGDAIFTGEEGLRATSFEAFYRYNKKTEEKEKYAERLMKC